MNEQAQHPVYTQSYTQPYTQPYATASHHSCVKERSELNAPVSERFSHTCANAPTNGTCILASCNLFVSSKAPAARRQDIRTRETEGRAICIPP